MKSRLIVFFLLVLSLCAEGRDKDKQVFVNSRGNVSIHLYSDKFYMIIHQPPLPWYYTDTLAVCELTKVTDEFYMINSEDPTEALQNSLIVSQEFDTQLSNSISLTFDLPLKYIPMKIVGNLNNEAGEEFELQYHSAPVSIQIPASTKRIIFGLEPEISSVVHEHPHGYTFEGVIAIYPKIICEFNSGANKITIRIPALTESFFERYYIDSEYIRLQNDTLTWRGTVFKLSEQ